jgi:glycine hydroxymethyltransferase
MFDKVFKLIKAEENRQSDTLAMIPSENYASKAVREAVGSVLMNKYSEGYSGRRYYQGNKIIDEIEILATERAKKLFSVPYANVQPYSGSPANSEVLFALCEPGETIMGMQLSAGGHLTHGHPKVTFSGKYFNSVQFGLGDDGLLDYVEIQKLAKKEKPKLMLIGTTAYPLVFDWKKFGEIADSVGAWLVADVSHVIGLIISGEYPTPFPHAHLVTSTTHKTLRGPRGAMILATEKGIAKDSNLPVKIDKAVIPGMQGGPHNNTTAGIAVALREAEGGDFQKYGKQIVKNAKVLAETLKKGGMKLVAGGTETHLIVIDLRPLGLSGNIAAEALEIAGIITNRNAVPNDHMPPFYPSGLRLGTPALTTRGMKEKEMELVGGWILGVLKYVDDYKLPDDSEKRSGFISDFRQKNKEDKYLTNISRQVKMLCRKFPVGR